MHYLEVIYTLHGSDNVFIGAVAAWRKETHPAADSPTGERDYQVLAGMADPIMAAGLIEEAIKDDGFVWIIGTKHEGDSFIPGPATLDNLYLIWGGDIHSGRVRLDRGGMDRTTPRLHGVAQDEEPNPPPHDNGPSHDAPKGQTGDGPSEVPSRPTLTDPTTRR